MFHVVCFIIRYSSCFGCWRDDPFFPSQLKQRGLQRHTIARALAYKWQRIMLRCWHDHQPYDETVYMQALEKRNPTLYAAALKIILPKEKKAA